VHAPDLNEAQRELLAQAGDRLRAAFPGLVLESEHEPAYFVSLGSIGVRVGAESLGEEGAMLEACAWIGRELPIDSELGLFLARRSAELPLGALCIDAEGSIFLAHALLAESVGDSVLERLVRWLAHAGETLDRELQERFGT
jgi:hypothetical protein